MDLGIWLALDADTREIVGVHIGARDEATTEQLWNSLPAVYRQCAFAYTDFWAADRTTAQATSSGGQREWQN